MKLDDISLRIANSIETIDKILVACRPLYGRLLDIDRHRVAKYILGCNRHNIKIDRVQFFESYYSNRIWPDPTKYLPDPEYIWSIQIVLALKKKKVHLVSLSYPYDTLTKSCIAAKTLHTLRLQRASEWELQYKERLLKKKEQSEAERE